MKRDKDEVSQPSWYVHALPYRGGRFTVCHLTVHSPAWNNGRLRCTAIADRITCERCRRIVGVS